VGQSAREVASRRLDQDDPRREDHIAACEEKLGQLVVALADYTAAAELAKQQNNAEVLAAIAEPMKALKARVPTLIIVAPAEATVMLDEKRLAPGVFGVAMPIDPGAHRVDAKMAGKPPYGATIRIVEKDTLRLEVKFEEPKTDNPPPPPPDTSNAVVAPPPPQDTTTPPPDTAQKKSGSLIPPIATAGGAVGLLALGIGAFVAADGAQGDLKNLCATSTMCPDDKKGEVHAWDTVALLSWIGAAGLAGVSIYFFATSGKKSKSDTAFVIGPAGATIRGRF
jgi:hypothetical protein